MAETDILNPVSKWVAAIDDNPSPDYGFTRGRADLRVRVKAPGGPPVSREVQNAGHTFKLSWLNRSYACVQMVMRYAAQYEDGYFTIVDWDGGGRHYVDRFVGDINLVQLGNDSYDLRDLTFEEFPGAPMLQFPNAWDADSIFIYAFADGGKQNAYTSGHWATQGTTLNNRIVSILVSPGGSGNVGEFLAMSYRGYGFRLWMLTGRAFGQVQLWFDEVFQFTVDLYADSPDQPAVVFGDSAHPLGLHRGKLIAIGGKNAASLSTFLPFIGIEVMR